MANQLETLDGGLIHQGDTHYLSTTFKSRESLSSTHPLRLLGFQTEGYGIKFEAKKFRSDSQSLISLSPVVTSPDNASIEISPEVTKDLSVDELGLELFYEVQVSNGAQVFTTEKGKFTVTKELITGV